MKIKEIKINNYGILKNKKINFKRIIIIATLIYVVYTFFVQQKELNAYKADSKRYSEQIATEEEKKERELLRKEYIASVRMNLRAQLDNVDVQQEDGTIINLGEKYGIKKRH